MPSAFFAPKVIYKKFIGRVCCFYQATDQYSGALPVMKVYNIIIRKSIMMATPSVQSSTVAAVVPIFEMSFIIGLNANAIIAYTPPPKSAVVIRLV